MEYMVAKNTTHKMYNDKKPEISLRQLTMRPTVFPMDLFTLKMKRILTNFKNMMIGASKVRKNAESSLLS